MEELPSITPLHIYEALNSTNGSTGNTMEVMKNNAISIFMYQAIMNFSSDELNNLKNRHGRPLSLQNLSMAKRDPLVFTALVKKGVELDKLEPHCKWLVENFPDMPLKLYEVIYSDMFQKPSAYSSVNATPDDRISYFFDNLFRYLEKQSTPYTNNLLEKFYEHFQDSMHVHFLKAIVNNVEQCPNTVDILVSKIKELGNNLNEDSTISLLLPKETDNFNRPNFDFKINTKELESLEKLFLLGFSPHTEYTFHGNNLLTSLLNSGKKEQTEKVLPYLLLSMDNNNIEEDKKLIETLQNQPTYGFIRATYFKALFENLIPNKEETIVKNKLKI